LTARAFQAAVSEETFAVDLLGGYTKAMSCVPGEFAAGSGANTAPLTITIETGAANPPISNPVYAWNVILITYRVKLLIAHLLPSTMKPQYQKPWVP